MSENKGTYVFNARLLNKRIEDLAKTPIVPANYPALQRLTELALELGSIAETALKFHTAPKPTYSDDDVRELARHLNAIIKSVESDPFRPYFNHTAISDAREFLQSKKYFNLNQSDIIV